MTDKVTLFETAIFVGTSEHELVRVALKANEVRPSEEDFFPWCIDLVFSLEGEEDHERTVYGPTPYHCIIFALSHWRSWVREILLESERSQVYLFVDGEYRQTPPDMAFATNDCITWDVEDKVAFAEANGYREDWDSVELIEPETSKTCKLALASDFGQIQLFDENFDALETPDWNAREYRDFACFVKGALFLRVMENDDHEIDFELLESEPPLRLDEFVHVVDAPFSTSGLFEIAEQPVKIPRGRYSVRWSVSEAKSGQWKYQIAMWPVPMKAVSVRKRYEGQM